jgi:hypothetical protein
VQSYASLAASIQIGKERRMLQAATNNKGAATYRYRALFAGPQQGSVGCFGATLVLVDVDADR